MPPYVILLQNAQELIPPMLHGIKPNEVYSEGALGSAL